MKICGEIKDIKADEGILDANGLPDIMKVKTFIYDSAVPALDFLGGILGKCYSIGRR